MTKPRDPEVLLSAYLAEGMKVLPERVAGSIMDEIHRTRQQAVFGPWRTRSRSLLIAAALLVGLALAGVAAAGASRLLHRDPLAELNLERPTDIPAFVLSAHDRLPQLPPVAITTLKSDATKDRIYVDGSGTMRLDQYASADATEPVATMLLSGTGLGRTLTVGPKTVWVESDWANGDPRRFILSSLTGLYAGGASGCEMTRDSSETGNVPLATGWRYISAESVAGRPAHHLACAGDEVWIDDGTRLILRIRTQDTDDAGNPIPGAFSTTEVTKIEFGEQPAALFAFAPPTGVSAMSMETYRGLCPGDTAAFLEQPPCDPSAATITPTPQPAPHPTATVRLDPSDCAIPSPDPGRPVGPLAWTQASREQDWPAPVRPEPSGGANAVPMPPTYVDPAGDTGPDVLPCVDIRDLTVGEYGVFLDLVSNRPPDVDPTKAWIAYGVVVDDDRDGVPDWRYGIDNLPRTAGDEAGHHRQWRTDLHTGQTEWAADSDWARVSESYLATGYPAEAWGGVTDSRRFPGDDARFYFGNVTDTTQGTHTHGVNVDFPFYTWASVIVDGRVVATDYAPDAGWLLPTPGATPGGTYVLPGVADGPLPFRLSMSIPEGWAPSYGYLDGGESDDGGATGLEFLLVDDLPKIACDRSGGTNQEDLGPSVDDLVAFVESLQTKKISDKTDVALKISEKTPVTIDGYRGTYLEYTSTIRDDNCNLEAWPGTTHQNAGRGFSQAWILDVDGVRLVIHAFAPKPSETHKAEIRRIVESIDIGP